MTVEELNKDLRSLQKQTRETKYSSMMQLLRLALSGRQVKRKFGDYVQCASTELEPKFYKSSPKPNPGSALVPILQVPLTRAGICLQEEKAQSFV